MAFLTDMMTEDPPALTSPYSLDWGLKGGLPLTLTLFVKGTEIVYHSEQPLMKPSEMS